MTTAAEVGDVACGHRVAEDSVETSTMRRRAVQLFGVLASDLRLQLLTMLDASEELTVGELVERTDREQSAVSHQLKKLREARLVSAERRGKQVAYRLHDGHVAHIIRDALEHVAERQLDATR